MLTLRRRLFGYYGNSLGSTLAKTPLRKVALVYDVLWLLPRRYLGRPLLAIFEPDVHVGWRNKANAKVRHGQYEFSVRYSTDQNGCRRVPFKQLMTLRDRQIRIFGCSWTFGHGVGDGDTYAAQLAQLGWSIINHAVMGYGLPHVARQLDVIDRSGWQRTTTLVAWQPEQLDRSWRRETWLVKSQMFTSAHGSHPLYEMTGPNLTYQGLQDVSGALKSTASNAWLMKVQEWRVTMALLSRMHASHQDDDSPFYVVLLPHRGTAVERDATERMRQLLERQCVPFFDLEADFAAVQNHQRSHLFYPFDGHPNPAYHNLVARLLDRRLASLS